jgi:mRNA interferase MazF
MYQKDYKIWHTCKAGINNDKIRPNFHEREVWFCSIGENIGFEQDGRGESFLRPVLVIRKFNNEVCLVIPLTMNQKKGIHYFRFSYKINVISTAILSQLRLIDSKRLEYKSGDIDSDKFVSLKEKLKRLIA